MRSPTNLIGITIRDFQAGEVVFEQYHQFKTIEPVSPEILNQVCVIRDTADIDFQMRGNELAYLIDRRSFLPS